MITCGEMAKNESWKAEDLIGQDFMQKHKNDIAWEKF